MIRKTGEAARGVALTWAAIALVIVTVAGASMLWLVFLPAIKNRQTEVTRNTNEFVQAKQTVLITLMQDYTRVDSDAARLPEGDPSLPALRGQQQAIIERMVQEANYIDADQVPPDVRAFLAAKGVRR